MGRTLAALLLSVALLLTGCAQAVEMEPEPEAEPIASYLLEQFPEEVGFDGITFRVPEPGNGWEEPDYIDQPKNKVVSVFYQNPEQDDMKGNYGVVDLSKCGVNPVRMGVENLGTDLSDVDYINAGMDHFDDLHDASPEMVYDVSDWEVRHDPGGVVCSCHVGTYPDPRITHSAGYLITGSQAFIYTDHGSYTFASSYVEQDFGSSSSDDVVTMIQIAETLRVQ